MIFKMFKIAENFLKLLIVNNIKIFKIEQKKKALETVKSVDYLSSCRSPFL